MRCITILIQSGTFDWLEKLLIDRKDLARITLKRLTTYLILVVALVGTAFITYAPAAYAHREPSNCGATGVAIEMKVELADGTVLPAFSPLVDGATYYYAVIVSKGSTSSSICADQGGSIFINGIQVNPPPTVWCMGGTNQPTLDCSHTSFESNRLSFVADCDHAVNGVIVGTSSWENVIEHFSDFGDLRGSAATQIQNPCVAPSTTLTKTADKDVYQFGEFIHYAIAETNNNSAADNINYTNVVITDSTGAAINGPFGDDGNGKLTPGETWTYNYTRSADVCGEIPNNVTAVARVEGAFGPDGSPLTHQEDASKTVTVECSASTILTKTANPQNAIITDTTSVNVTYRYNETNDGDESLTNVKVTDNACSPITRLADNPGNNNAVLEPGESWFFQCVKTFSTPGNFTNVAIGNATAPDGTFVTFPNDPDERAEAKVEVDRASTILTKTASVTSGTAPLTVIYTYTERNDGTVPLTTPTVTDNKCSPVTYSSGDNGSGVLDAGETWTFNCTVTYNNAGTFTNDATGSGIAPDGTIITYPIDPQERASTTVTVSGSGVTRTPGYWQTHLTQSTNVWSNVVAAGNELRCGSFDVNSVGKLMGGFWSSVTRETDGDRRTSLDQARMQLAFQLEAAILNNQAFGSSPDSFGTSLADAKTAFCGNNRSAMLTAASHLDAFNNSGDLLSFPPGFVNTTATPKAAYDAANRLYWDQPTLPG